MRKHNKRRVFVIIIVGITILGFIHNGRSLHSVLESSSKNFSAIITNAHHNDQASKAAATNNDRSYFWETGGPSTCFHLDHVCRTNEDGWFYAPVASGDDEKRSYYQPTATLLGTIYDHIDMLVWDNLNDFHVDDRIRFHILHNSTHLYSNYGNDECIYDATPNHLIAQSAYNEMMGEFYVRTLLGLNRWMRSNDDITDSDDIQIYIHLVEKCDSLFVGHRLFLGGIPNNNQFESFLSLMPTPTTTTTMTATTANNDLDAKSAEELRMILEIQSTHDSYTTNYTERDMLNDVDTDNDNASSSSSSSSSSSQCRCFTRLVFCGYYMENSTTLQNDNVTEMFPRGNIYADLPEYKDGVRHMVNPNFHRRQDGGEDDDDDVVVAPIGFKPHPSIDHPAITWGADCDNYAFRDLRNDIFSMHTRRFANLDEKIRQYKMNVLDELGLLGGSSNRSSSSSNNNNHTTINNNASATTTAAIDKWKLIGFARRKSRRLWLNINDGMVTCNSPKYQIRHHVACIIVDVEEASTPEEQLIMHRSLFALIGIHGAQLTQGILLPKHANVLEILPWIPSYLSIGGWVASTNAPTALGVIYHNTDVNHYGYALGRNSTPLCSHINMLDEDATRECLLNENDGTSQKFQWDVRDFIVPVHAIEDFLTLIIMQQQQYFHDDVEENGDKNKTIYEDIITCDEMRIGAEERDFVLYNAYCRQNVNESSFVTEHYYREHSW